jgi:uncharacterized protein
MRPTWTLTADGEDVTARLADYLISLSVSDKAGMESDQLDVVVADPLARIAWPRHGASLTVAIGYAHTGTTAMGTYRVDGVEVEGPPRQITIRAHAADLAAGFKAQRSKSWEAKTLAAIVSDLAQAASLTPRVAADLAATPVARWDQTNESDMSCLTRLAQAYGALATPKAGYLLFVPRGTATSASGQALAEVVLRPSDVTRWKVAVADQDQYAAVEARHYDRDQAQETWARAEVDAAGSDAAVYRLRQTYPDPDRAQAAASAKAGELARGKTSLSLTLPGRTALGAEVPLTLEGFGDGIDGRWVLTSATHRIASGGYTTEVSGERPV